MNVFKQIIFNNQWGIVNSINCIGYEIGTEQFPIVTKTFLTLFKYV